MKKSVSQYAALVKIQQAEIAKLQADVAALGVALLTATKEMLPNLPDRNTLEKHIQKAIDYASEHEQHMALLYLDLDNFKMINDNLGYTTGDHLLKTVASILVNSIQKDDVVCKLESDEFVIILKSVAKPNHAGSTAQIILDNLAKLKMIHQQEIIINASIGIAVYPFCGSTSYALLSNADAAMCAAKILGKNQYRFFTKALSNQKEHDLLIMNGLRNILGNQELYLNFQPIIDLKSTDCSGIEVLLRWQHPLLGALLPEQFLPFAEKTGDIVAIGRWVLAQALDDYQNLPADLGLFIAINMSSTELTAQHVEHSILSALEKHSIPAQKLIIEVTETIMHYPELMIEKIKYLTQSGVKIAFDDYGIGYSSLDLLKKMPLDILKIDKTFVADIGYNPHSMIIIKSTIQLAHELNFKVVAEGVETAEQAAFLQAHDCDYVQGYYFSKPLGLTKLQAYLSRH